MTLDDLIGQLVNMRRVFRGDMEVAILGDYSDAQVSFDVQSIAVNMDQRAICIKAGSLRDPTKDDD